MRSDLQHIMHFLRLAIKNTPFKNRVYLVGGSVRDEVMGKYPIQEVADRICSALTLSTESKAKYKMRLLLNPMWADRMARLNLTTHTDLENKKLIGINWSKIAQEMPSEKVLLEVEWEP